MTFRSALWRRGFAAGALVVAAVATVGAAPAAHAQTTDCTKSDSGADRIDGGVSAPGIDEVRSASSIVTVEYSFSSKDLSGNVNSVHLVVSGCDGQPTEGVDVTKDAANGTAYQWQTPALPYNGHYKVAVTASASSPFGPSSRTIVRPFYLAVPPAAPKDVRQAASADGTSVVVSWDKNPEPDLGGYIVEWTKSTDTSFGDALQAMVPADPKSTDARVSYTSSPGPGSWRYRVRAVRAGKSTATEDLLQSGWSTGSGSVTVTEATTTTAAATSGGTTNGTTATGSGSTSGSSTGSGSASGSTATTAASTAKSSPKLATAGKIDLSSFSALLDQQRKAAPKPVEPDPGFDEKLPFKPADEPALGDEGGSNELGADSDRGVTSRLISDDSDRRRAMGFVAGALLAFVIALQLRWVKAEVDRVPDLEPAPFDDVEPFTAGAAEALAGVVGVTVAEGMPATMGATELFEDSPRARRRARRAHRAAAVEVAPAAPADLGNPGAPIPQQTSPEPAPRDGSSPLDVQLPPRRPRRQRDGRVPVG